MIAGVIVGGTEPRRVLVSGVGPDLANFGVTNVLADPTLGLFVGQTAIATNDNWQESPDAAEIEALGLAPAHPLESAILMSLAPGEYTAFLAGQNMGTGNGLVQAFDTETGTDGRLVNISTRARVGIDDARMIAGFIITGDGPLRVVVRALGPTLGGPPFAVPDPLADTDLYLFRGGTQLAQNDNWGDSPDAAAIAATGLAPPDELESAILIELTPGAYTGIVAGTNLGEGAAIIEVYEAPAP